MRAKTYAIDLHSKTGCTYDGFPYELHLKAVVAVAERYMSQYFSQSECEMVCDACWLHDVIEDCRVTYNDLKKYLGEDAANIVYAVTNEQGKNRKERIQKTYPKIRANEFAIFVKLCDRIANTLYSFYSSSSMYIKYGGEFAEFERQLRIDGMYEDMWEELSTISRFKFRLP